MEDTYEAISRNQEFRSGPFANAGQLEFRAYSLPVKNPDGSFATISKIGFGLVEGRLKVDLPPEEKITN